MPDYFAGLQKTIITKKLVMAYIIIGFTILTLINAPYVQAKTGNIQEAQGGGLSPVALIDKSHPLQPFNYVPQMLMVPPALLAEPPIYPEMQLDPMAAEAITKLFQAAEFDDITLMLSSGYRSYSDQAALYASSLARDGAAANEVVALPGYSEHQSGLAADVILSNYFCAVQGCFALSKAAAWLNHNAYKYGFVVRYPLYKEASTGYEYEPWHIRYLGIPLAKQLYARQETLEEFYGLP